MSAVMKVLVSDGNKTKMVRPRSKL